MEHGIPLGGLVRGIKEDPRAYHNLRHVGMFKFGFTVASASGLPASTASLITDKWLIFQKPEIIAYMKVFIALPHLSSIQAKYSRYAEDGSRFLDSWDEALLTQLSLQHENLRRVYLYVRYWNSRVPLHSRDRLLTWVRNESWSRQEIPLISSDDIARAIL